MHYFCCCFCWCFVLLFPPLSLSLSSSSFACPLLHSSTASPSSLLWSLSLSSIHPLSLTALFGPFFSHPFVFVSFPLPLIPLLGPFFSHPFAHCLPFLFFFSPFFSHPFVFVSFPLPFIPLFHWLPPFPLIHSLIVSPSYFSLVPFSLIHLSLSLSLSLSFLSFFGFPFPLIHLPFVSPSCFSFLSLSSIPKTFFLLFLWVPSLIQKISSFFLSLDPLSFLFFSNFLPSFSIHPLSLLLLHISDFLMLLVFLEGFTASLFFILSSKG